MKRQSLLFALFVSISIVALLFTATGCRKEEFATSPDQILEFSKDTVFFDTVFTSVGSTTQRLQVYNRHDKSIKISSIHLRGDSDGQFIINVDGDNGQSFSDIEILPNDSMYLFVEVTVDPNSDFTPFIIEDQIVFETNGTEQLIQLNAWGQNAYFHGESDGFQVLQGSHTWNNDLPHVVYGIVALDEGGSLTINEGTQVYVHSRSGLYIYKSQIHINGTLGNEVVFQGDRLEPEYDDIPGQWGIQLNFQLDGSSGPEIASVARGGIWLMQNTGSTIDYAIIKNGGMGIQVDTTGTNDFALEINNTKITNMSGIGFWCQGAYVKGTNMLVSNCGDVCGSFSIGGKYQMDNCTFANYWSNGNRTSPTFVLNNNYEDINENLIVRPLTQTFFRNCIMYGNNAQLNDYSEFVVDLEEEAAQDYQFHFCLVDTEEDLADGNRYFNMVRNQAPYFCNAYEGNFNISANNSRMFGSFFTNIPSDIAGNSNGEWKGCYDYTPGDEDCN